MLYKILITLIHSMCKNHNSEIFLDYGVILVETRFIVLAGRQRYVTFKQ